MGGSSSKVSRAAGSAARQYPQRASAEATKAATSATSTGTASDPAATVPTDQTGPTAHTATRPDEIKNEAIDMDARDPQFASRLKELGPVKPYPTYSPSSTTGSAQTSTPPTSTNPATTPYRTVADGPGGGSAGAPATKSGVFPSPAANPAVAMLAARQRIADAAEREKVAAGRKGFEGKSFLDVATVRKILVLRDEQRMPAIEIEKALGLKSGTVGRLGRRGLVEAA